MLISGCFLLVVVASVVGVYCLVGVLLFAR